MTYALIALNALTVLAFLHHIREAKKTTDLQITGLLNRIERPGVVAEQQIKEAIPPSTEPLHINPEDDEAFWKATERYE